MENAKSLVLIFGSFMCFSILHGQNVHFLAHEWGTFTSLCGSDGKRLSGLYKEEESLPGFVHNIGGNFPNIISQLDDDKGFSGTIQLKNVTVKMETPVIYFYSPDSFYADVNIQFKRGLIGQWYPNDYSGVSANDYMYSNSGSFDFGNKLYPISNYIEWKPFIFHKTNSTYVAKSGETNTWIAPRETNSNVIGVGNEYEKFLFYRGIGNFDMPVNLSFDSKANLIIANNSTGLLPYFFVYEKEENGSVKVWWMGQIGAGRTQTVPPALLSLNESQFNAKLDKFQNALTGAGLYASESAAMLNTWKTSYFDKPGIRVFWIVPRSFTDGILPITINPLPDSLNRVLIGRSEILTPDFERELYEVYKNDKSLTPYSSDRFYLAYLQRMEELDANPDKLDSFMRMADEYDKTLQIDSFQALNEKISVYPNPVNSNLTISIINPGTGAFISIQDATGRIIENISAKNIVGYYQKNIDLSARAAGMYFVWIQTDSQRYIGKFVKN